MVESAQGSSAVALASPIPCIAAPVEPLTRQCTDKENQGRDSALSAVAPRAPARGSGVAVDGAAPKSPISQRLVHKQTSLPLSAPSSPSRFVHDGDNIHPGSIKRGPIRVGYLFKQSSGSWKRKRWNQRWFVLDSETGFLKYFRHESLPEAVPFRQDSHGVIHLKEPGASLVIQGDLPRNVPTPFCFTVCDASHSFLICADTNQEFREWTSAISAILSPRKMSITGGTPSPAQSGVSKRSVTDSAIDSTVSLTRNVPPPIVTSEELLNQRPVRTKPFLPTLEDDEKPVPRPTFRQTMVGLLVLNPFFAIVRYGSVEWMYASLLGMNVYFVWMLWIRKPPPVATKAHCILDEEHHSVSDDLAADVDRALSSAGGSPRATSGGASPRACDSPRKQTLPRIDKIPSSSFQPTKLLGVVNGVKAKAGDSVKMCPPAPAAFVDGCWTQISGTRYHVRQGPNYRKTKIKAPSEESLLDLVAVDIFRSPSKIDNIASIIDLGNLKPEDGPLDLFIVNCQVPSYQPSNPLWGEKQGNGEGFNFVSFFAIPKEVREQLNQHEPSHQAVRLLKNFMQDNSSVRDRFKAIGIVVNPQEQKLGRTERHLLETYNGQPILTRPQHRFYRGDGYFEVDVDAHEFNFVARKGLVGVSEHFRNMVVDFGYVLEGQEDAELPEQMLGAVRLCKIDVREALEIS